MTEMMGKVGTKMEWQRITEFLMSTKENMKKVTLSGRGCLLRGFEWRLNDMVSIFEFISSNL